MDVDKSKTSREKLLRILVDGCASLEVSISTEIQNRLIDYVLLLERWNQAFNLTAVRDPLNMMSRHVLDSLSILPWIHGARCIDVGTGPGLPGLVLAIAEPGQRHWTLLDSNGKKVRFLRQAVMELGLENIEIIQERVEKFQPPEKFDTLTSRAFAELGDMARLSHHLLADKGGRMLAMKGAFREIEREIADLAGDYAVEVISLPVAGQPDTVQAERHLVILEPRHR